MNGKNSAFPLMDLLMGFIKSPFTFPIMCFWKIFLCNGTVVTALSSHQCDLGSILRLRVKIMWVDFVCSQPCSERFFSILSLVHFFPG